MTTIQDRQLDFEEFSTDTEKISAILKRIEVASQKQKLSHEYYRARKFLLLTPAILSCGALGILSFVVSTDAIKDHMQVGDDPVPVKDVLTTTTGCLGFFVGVLLLFSNQWDFGARESMHWSAMIELEKLGHRARFWKMDRYHEQEAPSIDDEAAAVAAAVAVHPRERKALGVVETGDTKKMALVVASGKVLEQVEQEIVKKTAEAKMVVENRIDVSRFSGFNGAFHQILASCKSTIPSGIHRPFDLFESRLECQSLGHLGVVWDTRMRRNQVMRLAAIEIYNEISGFWLWPLATPDIDGVIDRSMRRVARLVSKDYTAPVKVQCCGFTLMRCCFRRKSTKSNAVDNIFKGIELREGELIEARGLTDYLERGDNKKGEYLLEDDAYSVDRRLVPHERDEYTNYSYSTRGSRSGYSRSAYSRGASSYSKGSSRGYLEDERRSDYSKSRGESFSRGGSFSMGSASYATDSNASKSRAESVYTEEGDSFTKDVAASVDPSIHSGQYSRSRPRPRNSGSKRMSNTSRKSRGQNEPSGYQYGVSGDFSGTSNSGKESLHWDSASDSQY